MEQKRSENNYDFVHLCIDNEMPVKRTLSINTLWYAQKVFSDWQLPVENMKRRKEEKLQK